MWPTVRSMSLLDRIGGPEPVTRLAHALYDRLLADSEVGQVFAETHMPTQREALAVYLIGAFSGVPSVSGERLREAHREHDVNDRHFSIMASHLADLLGEMSVDADTAADVLDAVAGLRGDIVSESVVAGTWEILDPDT